MRSFFAVPTQRTMERIMDIMSSAPIQLDFPQMVVPLALSVNADPSSVTAEVYEARVISFGHFFNIHVEHTQMVAVLQSPSMMNRAIQLGADELFELRWIIQNAATPLARTNKFWIRSVEDTLVSKEHEPFTFTERWVEDDA